MYPVYCRARALGVPPWEAVERPVVWGIWAQIIEAAEADAARQESDKESFWR